jgi:hypothetical protein
MLDMVQVFAWAHMFAGYARTESVIAAAKETFDPDKPCAICQAVSKTREAASQHGPAAPSVSSEKIVLILDDSSCFVPASTKGSWVETIQMLALVRSGDVPVPPPKVVVA